MQWKCSTCWNHVAVIDFNGDEPKLIGCVECQWNKVVQDPEDDHFRTLRCVAPTTTSYGAPRGRCSRTAVLNGMCWQHADRERAYDIVYARFRNAGEDDIPEAYREIFARACQDAHLLARDERNAERERELADRANVLRGRIRGPGGEKPSVVYFMRREGLIKIGITTNITARAKAISKGSSMPDGMTVGPVEVLATTPGDGAFEGKLHRQFAASRVQGEWFRPTPKLLRLIARYQRRADEAAA